DDHGALEEGNLLDSSQRFHAIDAWQPHVEQDDVEGPSAQRHQTTLAVIDGLYFITLVLKHTGERFPNSGLVINHQDARTSHAGAPTARASASAGASAVSSIMKRAPEGALFSARICPRCSDMMWFTIASP